MPETASTQFELPIPGQVAITVKLDEPAQPQPNTPVLILAHGSSNDLDFPLLVHLATGLATTGHARVLRFNFPYAQRGAASPDSRGVLEKTFLTVYEHVRNNLVEPSTPVFIGGKSLGARTAAELVSSLSENKDAFAAGLILLGYPLYSPGRKDRLYLEPLRHINIPSLFFVGTRDTFCDPDLLQPVIAGLVYPGVMLVIEGGDHSLHLPASSSTQPTDSYGMVTGQVAAFINSNNRWFQNE